MKKALFVIDVQNDFCPGGALPVPKGDEVVPVINNLMPKFDLVIATRDWHPENTVHFSKWPVHCVRNTKGAEFHPDLDITKINKIISKGTGNKDDGYSAFETEEIDLVEFLKQNEVEENYFTGLATEYCVKASAMDSAKNGFKTYVIEEAIRGIDVNPGDIRKAKEEMKNAGIKLISAGNI
jgi:nicotinamidase/pyrazinamidase